MNREKSYVKEICGPQESVQLEHASTGQIQDVQRDEKGMFCNFGGHLLVT